MSDAPPSVHDTVAAIWRIEAPRIVAATARRVRDVGVAEELAQDAMLAALQHWPVQGLPDRPGAWLMTTALNRAIDWLRHRQMAQMREGELALDLQAMQADHVPDFVDALDVAMQDEIGDDLLRLMFVACHPVLTPDARAALALKLLGGLTTAEIARAFLASEPTIAQRIVRAKRALTEAQVSFEVPRGAERSERLASVLEVIYLLFNEGHTATSGDALTRPDLCFEALRLGRLLAQLDPDQPEVHGLVALMEIQASRLPARTDVQGQPVLLPAQDRQRWDHSLISRGLAALALAEALGPADRYTLQAAIAACHARAVRAEDTDWPRIVSLYDQLLGVAPSPVVALNRAVALGMSEGPQAGLDAVAALRESPALLCYPWFHSVQAEWLERLGRSVEARSAWAQAAALTDNQRERIWLLTRADGVQFSVNML